MRKNSFKRIPGVLVLLVGGRQESTWTGYQSTGVSSQTTQAVEGRKELHFKQGSLLTTGTVFLCLFLKVQFEKFSSNSLELLSEVINSSSWSISSER